MKKHVVVSLLLVLLALSLAGGGAAWLVVTRPRPRQDTPRRPVQTVVAPAVVPRTNYRVGIVGYGSARPRVRLDVAPQVAGVKVLVEARPPVAVVAEPDIIEQAPHEMTMAGFGDTIAKYQSHADWVMNRTLFGEYYCAFCGGIVGGLEDLYLNRPEELRAGQSVAVRGLFEALFWSGVAMTLVGTSAPASGGEHLLSHTLDMMAEVQGGRHDLHGRQVGLGTLFSAVLYEKILAIDRPVLASLPSAVDRDFWAIPSVVRAISAQYEAKKPYVEAARQKIAKRQTWDRLREELAAQVKGPETIRGWLKRAGGAASVADIGCTRERVHSAVTHMHEIRKRFTVVDLAWLVGVLPEAADEVIDTWLAGDR